MHDDVHIAHKYSQKEYQARQGGYEFSLSFKGYKRLFKTKRCAYTGVTLVAGVNTPGQQPYPNSRTIDRIDSSKGYVEGNCVAISHAANFYKAYFEAHNPNNLTPAQAQKVLNIVKKFTKKKHVKCFVKPSLPSSSVVAPPAAQSPTPNQNPS